MTRRLLAPAAAALALLVGSGTAAGAPQPPPPPVTTPIPVAPPVPPAAVPAPAPPVATPPSAGPPTGLDAWAAPAAARLVAAGLWPELAGADLSRDATRGDLDRAVGILTGAPVASAGPGAPLQVRTARVAVIRALGLAPEMRALAALPVDGGPPLRMPPAAGAEILARELGLVHNQPSSRDGRERARTEIIRLADLVWMTDGARSASTGALARLARYRDVRLPAMSPSRRAVVQAALWQVGQPYVWAGDWPGVRSPWGAQAHGGFDCSGLVWWAFKGAAAPRLADLGRGLLGRTADAMAFEKRPERVATALSAPGDLVFFGPRGPASRPGTIGHAGIALGNGWMVHSSGSRSGVAVSHLDDYWPSATAFSRRVAELGA